MHDEEAEAKPVWEEGVLNTPEELVEWVKEHLIIELNPAQQFWLYRALYGAEHLTKEEREQERLRISLALRRRERALARQLDAIIDDAIAARNEILAQARAREERERRRHRSMHMGRRALRWIADAVRRRGH